MPGIPQLARDDAAVTWLVEKGHPQFVGFDPSRFADAIGRLRSDGVEIEVVYGIRDPLEAMWSMASYQQRDPHWYAFLDRAEIPDWIARSLESRRAMAEQVDGLVVDYGRHGERGLLRDLARRVSPDWGDADVDEWQRHVDKVLDPSGRIDGGGVFVGDGSTTRDADGPDGVWNDAAEQIRAARAAYEGLRA